MSSLQSELQDKSNLFALRAKNKQQISWNSSCCNMSLVTHDQSLTIMYSMCIHFELNHLIWLPMCLHCIATPLHTSEVHFKKALWCISSEQVFYLLSFFSSSCIGAVSGSCWRLNGVCLFQALGVDSLLLMQREREEQSSGRTSKDSCHLTPGDWLNKLYSAH